MKKQYRSQKIRPLFLVQAGLTLLISLLCLAFFSVEAAYSAAVGGLVCMIPNLIFANQVFRYQGARAAKKIVNSFYKGEAIKLILSVVLFAIVFIMLSIKPLAFFITYIVVQMTYWFAPWIIINK